MSTARARPCEIGTIESVRSQPTCAERAKPWVLAATILGSSLAFIDESIVNVALPAIETNLNASAAVIQWLINAYTLCLAALLLIGGAAGDRFGRRLIFVAGIAVFAAASLWCGLSPNVGQLIAARAVQGVGAALLIPCSLAIIGATFDETERGKAIGTWAGVSAIAAAIGPLLGGFIVDHASWRWIFLINPVLAVPTVWIALRHMPESRDPEANPTLDWRGAVTVFAGLGALVFGLIEEPRLGLSDARVGGAIAAGLLLLIAFVWFEAHSRAPMMPLALFRSRTFTAVNLLTLLLYAALGGVLFFLPFAIIEVNGYSATLAGAAFLPFTIIMGALSRWSGGLLDRFGARPPLMVGPAVAALGLALLAIPIAGAPFWGFLAPIAILGFGMAICVAPLTTTVINAVPTHQTGVASGINNAVATVANLLAVAIFGAVALGAFDRALDRRLAGLTASPGAQQAIASARGKFAGGPAAAGLPEGDRRTVEVVIRQSKAQSIRLVVILGAVLALSGAGCAALLPRAPPQPKNKQN
jgi:EmrB/QacA subfamily drug resistance transporter